uniref:RxLR effector candidate protein n=1 Tax=Peronospora matthiolae TaxID=2874970 RepID=A0AAV1T893_9STRA
MMRPTRYVVTAFAFLVLTSADSRTNVDSETNNEAVNISTLHSPLELTAFDGPGHLHSQDSTVAASDFVHRRDEERGLNDVVSHGSAAIHQGLQGELIALQKKAYTNFLEHVDVPSGSNQDLTLFQKLYEWSAYVELFNIQTRAFEDVEILEHMVKKFKVKRVIKFLHWLESFPPSKERASSLLEVITMKNSEDAEKIKQLCLTWEIGPDEINELMPIAAMGRLTGEVKKKAAWSSVEVELSSWLKYVLDFNMSYPEKYFDSKSVVTWLLNRRGVDETTAIFEQFLESRPIIYDWEKQLVALHPATLSRMLPRWLKADVKPRDVLRILPRAVEIRAHGVGGSTKWPGIRLELKLWIGYFKGWNRKHSIALAGKEYAHLFSEEIVLDTLEFCSGAEEVNAFLHGLRADNELKDLASKMEKLLPARRKKLMKIKLLAEAKAGPAEVFRKLPIAKVDRSIATFDRAGRAKQIEDPEVFFKKLKQFLGYVDAYRENYGEFSDNDVVHLLDRARRSLAEVFAYLQLFESVPGIETRAAQLLEAFREYHRIGSFGSLQKETREIMQRIRFYCL